MPSWNSPRLIILGRGNPEEAVLTVCKSYQSGGPTFTPCGLNGTAPATVVACETVNNS